jgi:methylglutaconyl-CoA hydratase
MNETEGYVKTVIHQQVGSIEFYHPQSNSLPSGLLEELSKAINHAAHDPEISVIILRSAGEKTFCAGASFDELLSIDNTEKGKKFFQGFAHVINAMRKCPKFIIARIQGKCVGGGVGLASAADYSIATDKSEIKLSELAVGIGPFVVGPAIERKIGISAFSQLAIDASMWRNADWARRRGLFAETHSSIEEMDESIAKLALKLSRSNSEAMAEMKKIFWRGTENWDSLLDERAAISGRLVMSNFTREAIASFKNKV